MFMTSNKILFENIDLGEKRQFILVKKLLLDIHQTIGNNHEIDLLLNVIKLGNAAELVTKGFLSSLKIDFDENVSFPELLGKNYLDKEYYRRYSKHLPNVTELKSMYKQRNQAQHGGILANINDLKTWFQKLEKFIEKVFSQIFDISFAYIDLAMLIKNKKRKNIYKEFSRNMEEEKWEDVLVKGAEIYSELLERYTQSNYYYIFELYIKYIDNENLFSSLEELFKRDILSFLNINPRDYWKIRNNSINVRIKGQINLEQQQELAFNLNDRLLELMLRLDQLQEEHEFKQHYFLCNDKKIVTQHFRLVSKSGKPKLFYATGIINNFKELKEIEVNFNKKNSFLNIKVPKLTDFEINGLVSKFHAKPSGINKYTRYYIMVEETKIRQTSFEELM